MTTARFTQSPISQTLAPIPCMARKAGQTGNKLNSKVLQGDAETMTPLPSLSRLQSLVQQAQQFDISDKTPWSLIDKARRNLAYEALYAKGRAQALKHIHEKVKVLLKCKTFKILRALGVFLLHACTPDNLKLMELDRTDRERVDHGT